MNGPNNFIVGLYEHPTRKAEGLTRARLHADVAHGALADASLSLDDVDGYFCAADAPGLGALAMAEHLGLNNLRCANSTETGGSSYMFHVQHAMDAIRAGHCDVALITMADNQLGERRPFGLTGPDVVSSPDAAFGGLIPTPLYSMVAARHMYEYGTTSEQLAWIKVAASYHAQHNPHCCAMS